MTPEEKLAEIRKATAEAPAFIALVAACVEQIRAFLRKKGIQ